MKKIIIVLLFLPFLTIAQSIVTGDTTSSNILYTNIKDTLLPFAGSPPSVYNIDADNDSIYDMSLSFGFGGGITSSVVIKFATALLNVEFYYQANNNYVDTIAKDSTINQYLNWKNITPYNKLRYVQSFVLPPPGSTSSGGNFVQKNNYLAFRKITATDTLYGWVLLDMSGTIKIKSYAIEKTNQNVGIKENPMEKYSVRFPNPVNSSTIDALTLSIIDEFTLLDMLGKQYPLVPTKIATGYELLLPPNINSGIYFLRTRKSQQSVTKKIVITGN